MAFAIFDIETRVDKHLLNQVFFADEQLSDEDAYLRFRGDLRERGSDFFPLTLHVPISIAVGYAGDGSGAAFGRQSRHRRLFGGTAGA